MRVSKLLRLQVVLQKPRGSEMARQMMQRCNDCGYYSLSTVCPTCGGTSTAAAPLKWSPEDKRAHLRRKLEGVEEDGWAETLPTLTPGEEE